MSEMNRGDVILAFFIGVIIGGLIVTSVIWGTCPRCPDVF